MSISKHRLTILALCTVLSATAPPQEALADTFGSGANTFEIEFVPIGNPGNPADTTGTPDPAGQVAYAYRMSKYEISEDMINKAVTLGGLNINHDNRGANKPATSATWLEAASFVNWLNISKGHMPAYKFSGSTFELWQSGDAGYDPNNLFRNSQAFYFLPSIDEWYKAAYYDPNADVYHLFPTSSDNIPDGINFAGDPAFDAVFEDGGENLLPNDITDVGVLSPYGTAGQGGNVMEILETEFDLVNDSADPHLANRVVRGGIWRSGVTGQGQGALRSTVWITGGLPADTSVGYMGFRVASMAIPEPSTALLGGLACMGLLLSRRHCDRLPHFLGRGNL
jgi:formylglycine-generating enzyme required for sulfatase activity